MILETQTRKRRPAITSDRWHVVRATWTDRKPETSLFTRTIVSEHDERGAAVTAARVMAKALKTEMAGRPARERDEVCVRAPRFRSVKRTRRWHMAR